MFSFFNKNNKKENNKNKETSGFKKLNDTIHDMNIQTCGGLAKFIYDLPSWRTNAKNVYHYAYELKKGDVEVEAPWNGSKTILSYSAQGYENTTPIIDYWAFSIRGTVPTHWIDLLSDLDIALGLLPRQLIDCLKDFNALMDKINSDPNPLYKNSLKKVPIYFIGHSLGSCLATCMFAITGGAYNALNAVYSFENPGSAMAVYEALVLQGYMDSDAIDFMKKYETFVLNIQSDYNFINTHNPQWGYIAKYFPKDCYFGYDFCSNPTYPPQDRQINNNFLLNLHYLCDYSLWTHNIDNMFISNFINTVNYYPSSSSDGYHNYLNRLSVSYNDDTNSYWHEYFMNIYYYSKSANDLQEKYGYRYDDYDKDSYAILDAAYNATASPISSQLIEYEKKAKEVIPKAFALFKAQKKAQEIKELEDDFVLINKPPT